MPYDLTNGFSRRAFTKSAAAAFAAPLLLKDSCFGARSSRQKPNLAFVGLGGMGQGNLHVCARTCNIVALCDVDLSDKPRFNVNGKKYPMREGMKLKHPGAKIYQDFRRMLIEMGDKIDAVAVATHDSNHFAVACLAMRMGKHVFVQKPLAHSIHETRILHKLASDKNLVTQMGNQGHAFEGMRLVKEWYQAGLIGEVEEVIAWTNRPALGSGFQPLTNKTYPPLAGIPDGLDWNGWLGPVGKKVGYHEELHPSTWRSWWDFGCGGLGDIGCHTIDTPYWALGLGFPTKVEAEVEEVNSIQTPLGSVVTYHFPASGSRKAVRLKWYEGPKMPPKPECMGDVEMDPVGGMIMIGSKGAIYHPGMRPNSPRLVPESKWREYRGNPGKRVPKTLPRTKDIITDWVQGITTGSKPCSDFSYSAPLTEVILLGTMAIRTGRPVVWDPGKMKVTNDNPEAAALVKVAAREGWRYQDLTASTAGKFAKG